MPTTNPSPAAASPRPPLPGPGVGPCQGVPVSLDERLLRINALGQRIAGFVDYISTVRQLTTSSEEAKEKIILDFYEKLLVVEKQLAHILDKFKLQ